MSDIHDLEQRLQKLEDAFSQQSGKIDQLLEKSDKALDLALHAYKVDHYGYIWQYDCETKEYVKSNMRVCTPEIADRALHSRHIADGAIEGRHLQDDCIGEKQIKDNSIPGDKFINNVLHLGKLCDDSVSARNIQGKAVHPRHFAPCVETDWLLPILDQKCKLMQKQINELRQLVTSYVDHGIALSNCLGANKDIGITQWRLTREIVALNNRINDITGSPGKGICVTITPDVFISETDGEVALTVTSSGEDILEKVKIYVNDELIIEREWTDGFIERFTLTDTSMVKTVVQIMGIEYTDMKVVTKLFPFFIGSGEIWTDAETVDNAQVYRGHLRGSYDMTVNNDGEKIFIIIPKSLSYQMIRADINGLEIPMIIREHDDLVIYESTNTYSAGRYNIDITCNCNCNTQEEETETETTEEETE